jgi:hypothetical protein
MEIRSEQLEALITEVEACIEYYRHQTETQGLGGEFADESRASAMRGLVRTAERIRKLLNPVYHGFDEPREES